MWRGLRVRVRVFAGAEFVCSHPPTRGGALPSLSSLGHGSNGTFFSGSAPCGRSHRQDRSPPHSSRKKYNRNGGLLPSPVVHALRSPRGGAQWTGMSPWWASFRPSLLQHILVRDGARDGPAWALGTTAKPPLCCACLCACTMLGVCWCVCVCVAGCTCARVRLWL